MFFAVFLIQDKNIEHDFIKELLTSLLHPLTSYVILVGMAMGKCTISHSLSHSCIFIHIYEGVIPLNVSVSLSYFEFITTKNTAFLKNMPLLEIMLMLVDYKAISTAMLNNE